jgi:UPF0755 protein
VSRDRRGRDIDPRDPRERVMASGGYGGPDPYAVADERYEGDPLADSYGRGGGYSAADIRDAYARDAYARAGDYPAHDGYPADDGYDGGDALDSYDPAAGYPDADGYGPQEGYGPGNGYSSPGRYDEPDAPYDRPGSYPPQDYPAQGGYPGHDQYAQDDGGDAGPPGDFYDQPADYPDQGRYPDDGPFRWRPDASASGPDGDEEDPGELPGRARRPGREPQQPRADGHPADWEDAPSGQGFIPGLSGGRGSRRGGRRRVGRVLAPVLAVVLLAAVTVGGYEAYKKIHLSSPDYTGAGTGQVTVQVLPGDTAISLAPKLVRLGVVASVNSFVAAAKASSNPDGLQPGFFSLHHHMNSALAYRLLLDPSSRIQTVVAIPEGLRATQILSLLQQKLGRSMPKDAFQNAIKDTAALGLPSYANNNPEGYLYPATYNINPGTSALAVLQMMVARFSQEAQSVNLPAAAQAGQLTEAQVITVASLLEAEVGPQYYAEAAEVIYNRLNQGMDLGLDSTVNYALNRFGVSLTQSQLQVNSPYNTFIHTGLPPGPIDSPGNAAIQAALHPDHGPELYFVTVNLKTGQTLFATTSAQFQQDEAECTANNAC